MYSIEKALDRHLDEYCVNNDEVFSLYIVDRDKEIMMYKKYITKEHLMSLLAGLLDIEQNFEVIITDLYRLDTIVDTTLHDIIKDEKLIKKINFEDKLNGMINERMMIMSKPVIDNHKVKREVISIISIDDFKRTVCKEM